MMRQILIGMLVMGYAVGGLFFFRFWKKTRDRLFLLFGLAFVALGFQQLLLGLLDLTNESLPLPYLIRLFAFGLILFAIVDKNVRSKR
jgi:hypothetical protein